MADDAVQCGFGRHGDDGLHGAGIDFLAGDDAVVEAGHDIAGAGGGFRLALDLQLVAARGDVDAQAILDRDQILVILPEQSAEQMRTIERDFQPRALGRIAARMMMRFLRHSAASLSVRPARSSERP